MSDAKELRLQIRVYNNRLKERREALRLSQRELATALGVHAQTIGKLENMSASPLSFERLCPADGCLRIYTPRFGYCRDHRNGPRLPPRRGRSIWRKIALSLASFFDTTPEELFPDVCQGVGKSSIEVRADAEEMFALTSNLVDRHLGAAIEGEQLRTAIDAALRHLTPREGKVLRMRFGIGEKSDHTLKEIGQDFEVSSERIRGIEERALYKLRRPRIAQLLHKVVDG